LVPSCPFFLFDFFGGLLAAAADDDDEAAAAEADVPGGTGGRDFEGASCLVATGGSDSLPLKLMT
jgi:hypothetical protein